MFASSFFAARFFAASFWDKAQTLSGGSPVTTGWLAWQFTPTGWLALEIA